MYVDTYVHMYVDTYVHTPTCIVIKYVHTYMNYVHMYHYCYPTEALFTVVYIYASQKIRWNKFGCKSSVVLYSAHNNINILVSWVVYATQISYNARTRGYSIICIRRIHFHYLHGILSLNLRTSRTINFVQTYYKTKHIKAGSSTSIWHASL